jgi:phage-related protein
LIERVARRIDFELTGRDELDDGSPARLGAGRWLAGVGGERGYLGFEDDYEDNFEEARLVPRPTRGAGATGYSPRIARRRALARTYRIRYVRLCRQLKPLVFRSGATIKTPPLTAAARGEVGYLLRQLQAGESLALPRSRPMPSIGARCHELRVQDETVTWRLVYRIDPQAIVVVALFTKKTQATPRVVITCQKRLRAFDQGT